MSDAPAFFRAIEANLDDDTPRLVYADWLDENAASESDHARAEFIRVQCERTRGVPEERRKELKAREEQLHREHGLAWKEAWPARLYWSNYVRGFLEPIHISSSFARVADRLAAVMPIADVHLAQIRRGMKTLAACPQLSLVRNLSMAHNGLRNPDMTAFAASPHLSNLQTLDVSSNTIGIRGTSDLTTARMPSLRTLLLADNPIKDRGLLAIAQTAWPALEHLDVSRCELQRSSVIGLAESPLVSRLTSLQLSGNAHVTTDAWLALARAPMARLERLDLSNSAVTDEVVEALAENPSLVGLRVLHLGAARITGGGERAILNSPHLRGLKRIRLPEMHLDAALREELRTAFGEGFNPPM
jgi:uncharacterized protein (TIGR02996 family)